MMKQKKGNLKNFVKKVAGFFPEAAAIGAKLVTGNLTGAIGGISQLLKDKAVDDENAAALLQEFEEGEHDFRLEAYKVEVEDKKDARNLYKTDSSIQKVLAIIFVIGYGVLAWYMIKILFGFVGEMPQLAQTMITMIFTSTSMKVNTIIDFFFGGSA